jgi:hypothetical protein
MSGLLVRQTNMRILDTAKSIIGFNNSSSISETAGMNKEKFLPPTFEASLKTQTILSILICTE